MTRPDYGTLVTEVHRLGEIAKLSDSMRDQFRVELKRTEGDLAVAIREASRARDALRKIRHHLNEAGDESPGLSALIHSAVREGLGE